MTRKYYSLYSETDPKQTVIETNFYADNLYDFLQKTKEFLNANGHNVTELVGLFDETGPYDHDSEAEEEAFQAIENMVRTSQINTRDSSN